MILEPIRFHGRAPAREKDLFGQPTRFVVVKLGDVRELIGVVGEPARGVKEFLDAVVRPCPRADPIQEIVRLIDRHAGGTDRVGGAVFNVVNGAEDLAKGVARSGQQTLVAVPVGEAVASVVSHVGQAPDLAVKVGDRVAAGIDDVRAPPGGVVEEGRRPAQRVGDRIEIAAVAINVSVGPGEWIDRLRQAAIDE